MQYQYQYRYPKTILCNANIGKNASDLALAIPIPISVMRIKFLQYQYHLNMDKFCNNTTSITIFHSVTVLSHSPALTTVFQRKKSYIMSLHREQQQTVRQNTVVDCYSLPCVAVAALNGLITIFRKKFMSYVPLNRTQQWTVVHCPVWQWLP